MATSTRKSLLIYLVLAYGLTWLIAVPIALSKHDLMPWKIPQEWHFFAQIGPMLAAFVTTWIIAGRPGVRELGRRMMSWGAGWRWLIVAIVSPVALFLLSASVARIIDGEWVNLRDLGRVDGLPYLGVLVVPLWILTNGVGEEVGWRGFFLPHLQQRHSALVATLILSVFWAFWHLPAFFYRESYQEMGLAGAPGFFMGLFSGAILLTWLYNSSDGGLLPVMIWHGLFNVFTASEAGQGTVAAVMSAGVMIWAVVLVFTMRPANLSREEKQTMSSDDMRYVRG
jgi:CAAX protease family protein